MPKNKQGGKKTKRLHRDSSLHDRELVTKEDGQEYGEVTRILGGSFMECRCSDGSTRLCHVRGKMKKKSGEWIGVKDIVLISLREYQDGKADIVHKYRPDEVVQLRRLGELNKIDSSENMESSYKDALEIVFDGNSDEWIDSL